MNMTKAKRKQCNLCLNITRREFGKLDDVLHQTFDAILLNFSMDTWRNLVICKPCMEDAKKCLRFKLRSALNEKNILSLINRRKAVQFDIKRLYQIQNGTTLSAGDNVCRFCMVLVKTKHSTPLELCLNKTVSDILPEMDLTMFPNPIVCTYCKNSIQVYLKFITNVLYMKEEREHWKNKLNLPPSKSNKKISKLRLENPQAWNPNESTDEVTVYGCSECPHKTLNERRHIKHIVIHDIFQCPTCCFSSNNKYDLKRHVQIHDRDVKDDELYECTSCSFKSKYKASIRRHKLIHLEETTDDELYECSSCSFTTKNKAKIRSHLSFHGEDFDRCVKCRYKCRHIRIFRNPKKVQEAPPKNLFKCFECPFQTSSKENMHAHLLVHSLWQPNAKTFYEI